MAVSTVYDYHKTALKNLSSTEYGPLIPLTGISAAFCERMQSNRLLIAAVPGIMSTLLSLAWCEREIFGLPQFEIRCSA